MAPALVVWQAIYKGTRLYLDSWRPQRLEEHLSSHYGEEYNAERAEKEAARKEWKEIAEGFGACAAARAGAAGPGVRRSSLACMHGQQRWLGGMRVLLGACGMLAREILLCWMPMAWAPPLFAVAGVAAKQGSQAMIPYLQNLYTSRAAAYSAALKQFVAGYREGLAEGMNPDQANPPAAEPSAPGAEQGPSEGDSPPGTTEQAFEATTPNGRAAESAAGPGPAASPSDRVNGAHPPPA